MTLILRLFFNIIAVWAAQAFVPGFVVSGGIQQFVIAGIFLGALNLVIKPIVKFFSAPLILLTLGLFTFVINAAMLLVVAYLLPFVTIQTFTALVVATIITGIVNLIASASIKSMRATHRNEMPASPL